MSRYSFDKVQIQLSLTIKSASQRVICHALLHQGAHGKPRLCVRLQPRITLPSSGEPRAMQEKQKREGLIFS